MNDSKLSIKTGGQWLVSKVGREPIFCREKFTQEQRQIDQMIREFARNQIFPNIDKINKFDKDLSLGIIKQMGELGLLGIDVPEELGGTNLDKISSTIVTEGVSTGGSPSFAATFGVQTGIGCLGIVFFGTPHQKEKYLPKLTTGDWIAAYALTEPTSGSDALSAKTNAVLSEDGKYYILNGEKQFVTNGNWATVFTVLAQIDGNKFSAFIVEKGTEGFEIGKEEKKMGMKGSSTTSLKFTNAKVPIENLLYEPGKGAAIAFNALNIGRYKLAASCIGGCKLGIELVIKYALERKQFGQAIAHFDSIKSKIADMTVKLYAGDSMLYRTVGMIQDAIGDLDESDPDYYMQTGKTMERFAVESSMAKVYGSETSDFFVDQFLQVLGGYGFIEEYPAAGAYRDDRINRIWEGTNEINRAIISGYMMKKVLMEKILLREFLKDLDEYIITNSSTDKSELLGREIQALESAKRLAALVFQESLCEFGQELKHEQQLGESLADIFTYIYTAGSVVSRSKTAVENNGKSDIPITIARIFCADALLNIILLVNRCLNKIFNESIPDRISVPAKQLEEHMTLETDTISLKQELAEYMYAQRSYPF